MLCPGLLSHLSCPQAAYCLNFDLYEMQRKRSLSQRCVNAVNDQPVTPSCSGHIQLRRLCAEFNPAGQQLCLQERREAAATGKFKASETIPFFPVCRKSREWLASNSHGDFFIKRLIMFSPVNATREVESCGCYKFHVFSQTLLLTLSTVNSIGLRVPGPSSCASWYLPSVWHTR